MLKLIRKKGCRFRRRSYLKKVIIYLDGKTEYRAKENEDTKTQIIKLKKNKTIHVYASKLIADLGC